MRQTYETARMALGFRICKGESKEIKDKFSLDQIIDFWVFNTKFVSTVRSNVLLLSSR